ncbi:MAG: hypothetical protein IPK78_11965 [Rhodospirillales bacterium]|nr:hypothetical protein [Rhodospirillales bacterium]
MRADATASALLAASLLLGGCAGAGDFAPEAAGLGAGAGAGVLTANPLVGVAVAMAVRLATAEALGYVEGEQQLRVQHAIAAAGGAAALNEVVPWTTEPDAPFDAIFGMLEGHLEVVRDFGGLIACRELLYTAAKRRGGVEGTLDTVESDVEDIAAPPPAQTPTKRDTSWPEAAKDPVLAAVICNGGHGWRWAVSRPAAEAVW